MDYIASIGISTGLDLSGLYAGLDQIKKTKIPEINIPVNVDHDALAELNKHLDKKKEHVKQINSWMNSNPITPTVDASSLDELENSLDRIEKKYTKIQSQLNRNPINISTSQSSQDATGKELDVNAIGEKLAKSIEKALIQSIDVITQPLQGALTGLFEGVGFTISEKLTSGILGVLKTSNTLDLDNISEAITSKFVKSTQRSKNRSPGTSSQEPANFADLKAPEYVEATNAYKQAQQEIREATRKVGRQAINHIVQSVEENISLLDQALNRDKPDLSEAKSRFKQIRAGFKQAHDSLKKELKNGNIELAEAYMASISGMAKTAREEIAKIQSQLKKEGASNRFGAELPTIAGSTKGAVTRYEKQAALKINEERRKLEKESTQIGGDVISGVAKGLSSIKPVIQLSSKLAFQIIKTLEDDLEIRSPSRKGVQIGVNFVKGIAVGISKSIDFVKKSTAQITQSLKISPKSYQAINTAPPTNQYKVNQPNPSQVSRNAQESAQMAMDGFFESFGQAFKEKALKGMPPEIADELSGEIAGMIFSGLTMAMPGIPAAVGLGPLLLATLPTVITSLGIQSIITPIINRAVQGIQQVEPIQKRLDVLGGSEVAGQAEFDYANRVASQYSVSKQAAMNQYSQLAIAARGTKLEGEGVKELFEGIAASTKALRLSTYDTSLVFTAYTQILAKGKVSMEELRQQLGEKFPPAMGVFAKAMGVTVPEMNQMIESGNALSEDILPKVAKVLKEDFGDAAGGVGGLTTALTKLENAGFDLSVKLTNAFSGLFGAVVGMAGGAISVLTDNFETVAKLTGAFLIGISAQLVVGLQQIMSLPAIANITGTMQGAFMATFAKSMSLLAPFMFGMFIDVADDFLGAQNSIFENMSKGITNTVLSIVTLIDDASRNILGTAFFKPDHDSAFIGFFKSIFEFVKNLIQILPSGVVEMGALMIMFEQVSVLGKLYLFPMLSSLKTGFLGMAKAVAIAFTNTKNLKAMFRVMIADSAMAKGAMIALNVAIKGLLAYGVMAFANSDIADELAKDFSSAEVQIVNSIKSIDNELSKLSDTGKSVGQSFEDAISPLELKSKGLELNPLKVLGMSEESFMSDDLIKRQNRMFRERINNPNHFMNSPLMSALEGRTSYSDQYTLEESQERKIRAEALGIGDFFSGEEERITKAQQQALNKAEDLQRMARELETRLEELNLTPKTVGMFVADPQIQKSIKEVKQIDQQLKELGETRSRLGLINDTQSKEQIREIDKELDALFKKRKDAVSPITASMGNMDEIKTQLDEVGKAIDQSDLPRQLKEAYHELLNPQKEMVEDVVAYLEESDLSNLIQPLENVWQNVTDALDDAEQQFEKTGLAASIAFKNTQSEIYALNLSKKELDLTLRQSELNYIQATRDRSAQILSTRESTLAELLSISGAESNPNRKEKITKLREDITKERGDLAELDLQLARSKSTAYQQIEALNKEIQDYYESVAKETAELAIAVEEAQLEITQSNLRADISRILTGGRENFVSRFLEGLSQINQQVNEVAKIELEKRRKALERQSRLQSNRLEISRLNKEVGIQNQLALSNSGSIPKIPVKLDLEGIKNTPEVRELNRDIQSAATSTRDLNSAAIASRQSFEDVQAKAKSIQPEIIAANDASRQSSQLADEVRDKYGDLVQKASEVGNQWEDNVNPEIREANSLTDSLGNAFAGLVTGVYSIWKAWGKVVDRIKEAIGLQSAQQSQAGLGGALGSLANTPLTGGSGQIVFPVAGKSRGDFKLESWAKFDAWRNRPGGRSGPHYGLDFSTFQGEKLVSLADGVITNINFNPRSSAFGSVTVEYLRNGKKEYATYGHISALAPNIREGSQVNAGQFIAKAGGAPGTPGAGSTSTGPHLDIKFHRYQNGKRQYFDPDKEKVWASQFGSPQAEAVITDLPFKIPKKGGKDAEFVAGVAAIAQKHGIDPVNLLALMSLETGGTFDPAARNNRTGATGLIQFIPATARGLGTSTSKLAGMTQLQQLPFVDKFFQDFINRYGKEVFSKGGARALVGAVFGGNPNLSGNASDGNINANQYVAGITGSHRQKALALIESAGFTGGLADTRGRLPQSQAMIEANASQQAATDDAVAAARIAEQNAQIERDRQNLLLRLNDESKDVLRQSQTALQSFRDLGLDIGVQTPEIEFGRQNQGVRSQYDEIRYEQQRQKESIQSAIEQIDETLATIELTPEQRSGLNQARARGVEALANIDNVLANVDKQEQDHLKYLESNYARENAARRQEASDRLLEIQLESDQALIQQIETLQQRSPGDMSLGDPIEIQNRIDLARQEMQVRQQIQEIRENERTGILTPAEAQAQIEATRAANVENTKALALALSRQKVERDQAALDRDLEKKQRNQQSNLSVLEAQVDLLNAVGIETQFLTQQVSDLNNQMSFDSGLRELERMRSLTDLSAEDYERQKAALEQVLALQKQQAAIALQQSKLDRRVELTNLRADVLEGNGAGFAANTLRRQAAIAQQNFAFQSQIAQLEQLKGSIPNEEFEETYNYLTEINELKLDQIRQQFADLSREVELFGRDAVKNFFRGFLVEDKGIFESLKDAFSQMKNQIMGRLIDLGVESIFKGRGTGGDTGGGLVGDFLGLFGVDSGQEDGGLLAGITPANPLPVMVVGGSMGNTAGAMGSWMGSIANQLGIGGGAGFTAPFNPMGNIIQTAISTVLGGFNPLSMIGGFLGFSNGGMVPGVDNGKDSIPAMLRPGEYVVSRDGVSNMGAAFLESVNSGEMQSYKQTEYTGSDRPPSREINLNVQYEKINDQDYVTRDQFEKGVRFAAQRGAEDGAKITSNWMKNSPRERRRHGI